MSPVREHDWRWKPGGGYYSSTPTALETSPLEPDFRTRRDRAVASLLRQFLPESGHPEVLELGCGASRWLPYLARTGCRVTGVDYEPNAADLAAANLHGSGALGTVLCRNAFDAGVNRDLVGRFDLVYSLGLLEHFGDIAACLRAVVQYVRPGGMVATFVPNLQGVNWILQRLADLETLETHVVYDVDGLRRPHEEAGLVTLAAGYAGFYDGFLSAASPATPRSRRRLHRALCRTSNMAAYAWLIATRGRLAPDLPWLAPAVYYVGRRPAASGATTDTIEQDDQSTRMSGTAAPAPVVG